MSARLVKNLDRLKRKELGQTIHSASPLRSLVDPERPVIQLGFINLRQIRQTDR